MARYIAVAVVVSLVISTAGIVIYRYFSTRHALEASARRYAGLVSGPLAQFADMFGEIGMETPVMNRISWLLQLNEDVERIDIVRENGSIVLTAHRDGLRVWPRVGKPPTIAELGLLDGGVIREGDAERVRLDGRTLYRVVIPGNDQHRSFAYSLVATFNYSRVDRQLQRGLLITALALALGLILTERAAFFLARGVTKNLADLQAGVKRIRAGRLDERVEIRSGDEIQELADAFNEMTRDLQRNIDRLRRANQELQALDQLKADLVANVSHELRTPLTALKGFLELMDDGELGGLPAEAHRAVVVCRRNVDRLALRVEELVQLSQMETGWPDELPSGPVDVVRVISLVTEVFEARILSKRLQLGFEHPDVLPEVWGNFEQIERLVLNLVDNAVKFTAEGGSIMIGAEECDHEGRHGVLIRVTDSGIGIPSDELIRIFDRFHQVDRSIRRRFGGMGLGLSLVNHIVESHGGIVWVESELGVGSTFFVWLPCRRPGDEDRRQV